MTHPRHQCWKGLCLSTFPAMDIISLRPTRNNQCSWEYKRRLILLRFTNQVGMHSFHGSNNKLIINNYVGYFYTYLEGSSIILQCRHFLGELTATRNMWEPVFFLACCFLRREPPDKSHSKRSWWGGTGLCQSRLMYTPSNQRTKYLIGLISFIITNLVNLDLKKLRTCQYTCLLKRGHS